MDTRTKIVTAAGLPDMAAGNVALVTGYFDILRASHIHALQQIDAGKLVVVVSHYCKAVLPLRARAELVAALRMVDYVITADDSQLDTLVSALRPAQIVHLEDADLQRATELKQHVQRRQSC
jgi:glycerol-3-phosphate cytidylyltransferase-like family protein